MKFDLGIYVVIVFGLPFLVFLISDPTADNQGLLHNASSRVSTQWLEIFVQWDQVALVHDTSAAWKCACTCSSTGTCALRRKSGRLRPHLEVNCNKFFQTGCQVVLNNDSLSDREIVNPHWMPLIALPNIQRFCLVLHNCSRNGTQHSCIKFSTLALMIGSSLVHHSSRWAARPKRHLYVWGGSQTNLNISKTFQYSKLTRRSHKSKSSNLNSFTLRKLMNLIMNKKRLPTSRTFRTNCPDGSHFAHTVVYFAHFQVQARKRSVLMQSTVPRYPSPFLSPPFLSLFLYSRSVSYSRAISNPFFNFLTPLFLTFPCFRCSCSCTCTLLSSRRDPQWLTRTRLLTAWL